MKHIKTLITIIAAALLIISIFTGAAAADNVTNSSTEQVNSYKQDLNAWYNYYKSLQEPNVGCSNYYKTLETIFYNILINPSLTWDDKQTLIHSLRGGDFRLFTYMNPLAIIIGEGGTLTYNIDAVYWWDNSSNDRIDVDAIDYLSDCVLRRVQVEGLYKLYREKYNEYVNASLLQAQVEGDAFYLENNRIMDFDEYVIDSLPKTVAEGDALLGAYHTTSGAYSNAYKEYTLLGVRDPTRYP